MAGSTLRAKSSATTAVTSAWVRPPGRMCSPVAIASSAANPPVAWTIIPSPPSFQRQASGRRAVS
jgi:hypothetical protein